MRKRSKCLSWFSLNKKKNNVFQQAIFFFFFFFFFYKKEGGGVEGIIENANLEMTCKYLAKIHSSLKSPFWPSTETQKPCC